MIVRIFSFLPQKDLFSASLSSHRCHLLVHEALASWPINHPNEISGLLFAEMMKSLSPNDDAITKLYTCAIRTMKELQYYYFLIQPGKDFPNVSTKQLVEYLRNAENSHRERPARSQSPSFEEGFPEDEIPLFQEEDLQYFVQGDEAFSNTPTEKLDEYFKNREKVHLESFAQADEAFSSLSAEKFSDYFVIAAENGHLEYVTAIIKSNRFTDIDCRYRIMAFRVAVSEGHLKCITAMINNWSSNFLNFAFQYCAEKGFSDCLLAIIQSERPNEISSENINLYHTLTQGR